MLRMKYKHLASRASHTRTIFGVLSPIRKRAQKRGHGAVLLAMCRIKSLGRLANGRRGLRESKSLNIDRGLRCIDAGWNLGDGPQQQPVCLGLERGPFPRDCSTVVSKK